MKNNEFLVYVDYMRGLFYKIKRNIYFFLNRVLGEGYLIRILRLLNLICFHWAERERYIRNIGNAAQNTIYVVRPRSPEEGLISSYISNAACGVYKAFRNGWIPYIDYSSNKFQYHDIKGGGGNSWECYFEQPNMVNASILLSDNSNIILSGWKVSEIFSTIEASPNREQLVTFVNKICPVKKYLEQQACNYVEEHLIAGKTLGVFVRGTDYVALRPRGHHVQPDLSLVVDKIHEFLDKYDIKLIFLVTEDYSVFSKIRNIFGPMVVTSDSYFVKDFSGKDYLYMYLKDDPYERGLRYLVRLLVLAKCDYLITSLASGSRFVLLNKHRYRDAYIFDLGLWD